MGLLADIRYALRRARAERYIEEQVAEYERSIIRTIARGSAPLMNPPARGGWDDLLTDSEYDRLDRERRRIHEKYTKTGRWA